MPIGHKDLLTTTITPPRPSQGWVKRPRLLELLGRPDGFTLAVVQGPAGYGKTTLLGQWCSQQLAGGAAIAWVSVDWDSASKARFFRYLVYAIRKCLPQFFVEFESLQQVGPNLAPVELAKRLLSEIAEQPQALYLVLDDLHFLKEPQLLDALSFLVGHAPENLHLIVATRDAPPFALGRLRAQGQLVEVQPEDLLFDPAETEAFFRGCGYGGYSRSQLDLLHHHTEGWAAGLRLAALSLGGNNPKSLEQLLCGEHRNITEFMADNVLNGLPGALREFLLRTSVLEKFNAALSTAVVEAADAPECIAQLEARHLFIFSLDESRSWFRYHHLFRAFLQRRLQQEATQAQIKALHARAAEWYRQHGVIGHAIRHDLEAGQIQAAARMLNAHSNAIFYSGRLADLQEWTRHIPAADLDAYPYILLNMAWALTLEWQFSQARELLDRVDRQLLQAQGEALHGDSLKELRWIAQHRRMMLAQFMDDMPQVRRQCQLLMQSFETGDPYLRGTIYTSITYAQRELFQFEELERRDAAGRQYFEQAGSRFVLVWHESIMGPTHFARGDLRAAELSLLRAREIAREIAGSESALMAMPTLLLAEVYYEAGRLAEAQALVEAFLPYASKLGFVDQLCAGYVCKARLQVLQGEPVKADETLYEATVLAREKGFVRFEEVVLAERIRVLIDQGLLESAARLLAESPTLSGRLAAKERSTRHLVAVLSQARLLIASGRFAEARRLCGPWQTLLRQRGCLRDLVRVELLLVQALRGLGDGRAAKRLLQETLKVAMQCGLRRSLIDELPRLKELLGEVVLRLEPQDALREYICTGLSFELPPQELAEPALPGLSVSAREPLSSREVEVLERVAQGLMNCEIAQQLAMTEGTVKWYMQQIFDKLGTRRRVTAVKLAKDLGMLG
jgi:LuxR family maltose regulon positive regulatory protein